mgnify:CR=1 FL=1
MAVLEEYYDAVVIGAGHAGCEAALACARLGLETICFYCECGKYSNDAVQSEYRRKL